MGIETDAPLLQTLVLDLIDQMRETNTTVGGLTTKLDMYMVEREKSDARARRYAEAHDIACANCQIRLHKEIQETAADSPFVMWSNKYKVLLGVAIALIFMFGRDLGALLIRLIAGGG